MDKRKKRQMNPNSLANLRPIKPGEVRNPKGMPKKEDCLLACIKDSLTKLSLNGKTTREQNIGEALTLKAEAGDLKAIEILMSYLHARPTASVDITSKGESVQSFVFALPDGTKKTASELANGSSNKT